jgi:Flp pilus assembly pilin Flp
VKTYRNAATRLALEDRGQTLVEYTLILAFVSIVAIGLLSTIGQWVIAHLLLIVPGFG